MAHRPRRNSKAAREEEQRNNRAWLAVKAFNELKPTLTSFARAVTGNSSINVQATKGVSKTDGRTLWLMPPIALGDRTDHDRNLCDKRDPDTLVKLCSSCAAREMLMRRLFHEIAHVAFDSNAPIMKYERNRIAEMIREWHPDSACKHAPAMIVAAGRAQNHLELADAFHPFLKGIFKSYEDARVDAKMYRARPGLKVPTEAAHRVIFSKGIERADGSYTKWIDSPLNVQIIIGLLLLGSGFDIREGYLSEEAIEALGDDILKMISSAAITNNSVNNAFSTSIEAFLRLQEMELCYVPKCVETPSLNKDPEPDDKGEDNEGDGNEGASDTSDTTPPPGETPESGDDSGDDGDGGSDDDTADGMPGDSADGDRPGDGGHQQDADDEPSSGDDKPEQQDGGSDGADQEGSAGDAESEEGDVPPSDDGSQSSAEDHADDDQADDAGSGHGDSDGGDPDDSGTDIEDKEPARSGESDSPDDRREDDDDEARQGDDGSGTADDDRSDRDTEADDEGDRPGAGSPDGDADDDSEAHPEDDLANADGPGGDEVDSDLDPTEDSADGSEAEGPARPELAGEDVWDEANPETRMVEGMSQEELDEAFGAPDEVQEMLDSFLGHDHDAEVDGEMLGELIPEEMTPEEMRAVATAVGQEAVFDMASRQVRGVQVVKYPHKAFNWMPGKDAYAYKPDDFMPSESIIGGSLMQARVVFSENKRSKTQGNLKSGRINTSVLGRRAALGDERLFKKKTVPGKRDYFVVIGADCSGSTAGGYRNERIKRAVFAKAELLSRLGIKFAIYGHTGGEGDINKGWWTDHPDDDDMTEVWLMEVKGPDQPWNGEAKQRLADMPPVAENLDGHTLEHYRKLAEKSTATDRIIIYYTDGAMPAANYEEELAVLQSEIETCRRKGIHLMAVGINTDSPTQYGFDTVQVDSDEDLSKVVDRLKARLTS